VTPEQIAHLRRAKDLVDRSYAEPLDVLALARHAHMSPAHFARQFKEAFGESPHQYVLTRRVERAMELLRNTDATVTDVCFDVGFQSLGSFSSAFRRVTDMTPTAYRAAYPPAASQAVVPACFVRAYGRPQHRTFREDSAAATS